jgi:hypothetical protein
MDRTIRWEPAAAAAAAAAVKQCCCVFGCCSCSLTAFDLSCCSPCHCWTFHHHNANSWQAKAHEKLVQLLSAGLVLIDKLAWMNGLSQLQQVASLPPTSQVPPRGIETEQHR